MELHVTQLSALSVATHLARNLAKENNMPDGKGWRLGHNKHYKKHNKASAAPNIDCDGSAAPASEESGDKRHQGSWLKTVQISRPPTPISTLTTATTVEDTEDTRSERSDTPVLPRESKPKLARYTSLFATFKETSKGPEFLEPWSEEAPPPFQPYIDPLQVMQSVRSHIVKCSTPVPLEHSSGLLRLFEDYRKIREQKEQLEKLLEETLENWTQAQSQWTHSEDRYNAEIRRLELLIARGTSGMEGLVQARQGSVLDRKRRHRKTNSHDKFSREYEQLPADQLDAEIKLLSQKVLLRRSVSPSGNMMALSKQFTDSPKLLVGTPPDDEKTRLSRKVQSELNLATMRKARKRPSVSDSVASIFSGGSGDALPDETVVSRQSIVQPATECNGFIALRELGTLVARQRGLQPESFNDGLMMLLSRSRPAEPPAVCQAATDSNQTIRPDTDSERPSLERTRAHRRMVRKFQSQPQLRTHRKHHRQFSFEPGADELQALTEELTYGFAVCVGNAEDSTAQASMHGTYHTRDGRPSMSSSPTSSLRAEVGKRSKIPSPVHNVGRSRKEVSTSSLHSIYGWHQDSRRGSGTSVVTAFREKGSGSMRPLHEGRNSSGPSLGASASLSVSTDYSSGTEGSNKTQAKALDGQ